MNPLDDRAEERWAMVSSLTWTPARRLRTAVNDLLVRAGQAVRRASVGD
jgi:hypothetical protein